METKLNRGFKIDAINLNLLIWFWFQNGAFSIFFLLTAKDRDNFKVPL